MPRTHTLRPIFYGRAGAPVPGPSLWLDGPFSSFGRLFMPTLGGVGDVEGDGYPDLLNEQHARAQFGAPLGISLEATRLSHPKRRSSAQP